MFDPGFRELWNNDFEAYFHSLFDEQAWESKMRQASSFTTYAGGDISRQMLEDPQFAAYMREQAIIEEVMSGELKPENAPVEMRRQLEQMLAKQGGPWPDEDVELEIIDEEPIDDPLYIKADKWAVDLSKKVGPLYEQFGDIKLFRVLTNCYIVAGKIAFAKMEENLEPGFQWQNDRVGYTLALTSLRRCLESLDKLRDNLKIAKRLNISKFLETAKAIQTQLIDRLDEIEQKRLKL
jgi:hypothetical protein